MGEVASEGLKKLREIVKGDQMRMTSNLINRLRLFLHKKRPPWVYVCLVCCFFVLLFIFVNRYEIKVVGSGGAIKINKITGKTWIISGGREIPTEKVDIKKQLKQDKIKGSQEEWDDPFGGD